MTDRESILGLHRLSGRELLMAGPGARLRGNPKSRERMIQAIADLSRERMPEKRRPRMMARKAAA